MQLQQARHHCRIGSNGALFELVQKIAPEDCLERRIKVLDREGDHAAVKSRFG